MGGLLPSAAMSALQLGMDAAQQQAARDAEKDDAKAQMQQIQQVQVTTDRQRRDQLRRALATQRARFGAQGLASSSGSADAVLTGIQAESEREQADSQTLSGMRVGRIGDQLDWQRRRSLLAASAPPYRTAFSLLQRGLRSSSLLDGE